MKQSPPTGSLPTVLQPAGTDETRQWYLYEQIRKFCEDEYKDITCPKPRVPKRKQQNQDVEETAAPAQDYAVTVSNLDIPKPKKELLHAHFYYNRRCVDSICNLHVISCTFFDFWPAISFHTL